MTDPLERAPRDVDDSSQRVMNMKRVVEQFVPAPWDRRTFLERVSAHRGRTIRLEPLPTAVMHGLPCGIWLVFADHDEIYYDDSTSDYHIDQTVLHEVGHMMLGHDACGSVDSSLRRLLPDLDVDAVKAVMARSHFDDIQESEAELFADLLMSSSVTQYRKSRPMSMLWSD